MDACAIDATMPHASGGLRGVIDALPRRSGDRGVLSIVTATRGSTYRKPGALLLRREHLAAGWLSGGCLEAELDLVAADVLRDGCARVHAFDTHGDDDLLFGSAIGCRGAITLLLLPVDDAHALVHALRALAESTQLLHLSLRPDGSGEAALGSRCWSWLASASATHEMQWSVRVAPPPRVLLCGAGPEAAPLLLHARTLGWYVEAIEHRGRWRDHARGADALHEQLPERAWTVIDASRFAAALVMGHHFGNDLSHLRRLADSDIGYIGLLGPPARRDALLTEIGEAAAARLRERLQAPAGMRLGGEGPEAIALSVAAGLQRHLAAPTP